MTIRKENIGSSLVATTEGTRPRCEYVPDTEVTTGIRCKPTAFCIGDMPEKAWFFNPGSGMVLMEKSPVVDAIALFTLRVATASPSLTLGGGA